MRAVVQRVRYASVKVAQEIHGKIEDGLLILLGVGGDDSEKDAEFLADKIANLRIFSDSVGKMNLSLKDIAGEALVVSQFTLFGDCRRGRRPSFSKPRRQKMQKDSISTSWIVSKQLVFRRKLVCFRQI